jgi:hypothetical protein
LASYGQRSGKLVVARSLSLPQLNLDPGILDRDPRQFAGADHDRLPVASSLEDALICCPRVCGSSYGRIAADL